VQRQGLAKGAVVGGAFVAAATVAGSALLYYLSLPDHTGPENSSPPPEGLGLIYGAALGCIVGIAAVTALQRSLLRAAASFAVAFVIGACVWLLTGSGTISDRVGDCLLGLLVLGPAAIVGLALGSLSLLLRQRSERRHAAR
jgi:hypothetical protein